MMVDSVQPNILFMQLEEDFLHILLIVRHSCSVTSMPMEICSIALPNKLFINQYKYKVCLNCVIHLDGTTLPFRQVLRQ